MRSGKRFNTICYHFANLTCYYLTMPNVFFYILKRFMLAGCTYLPLLDRMNTRLFRWNGYIGLILMLSSLV